MGLQLQCSGISYCDFLRLIFYALNGLLIFELAVQAVFSLLQAEFYVFIDVFEFRCVFRADAAGYFYNIVAVSDLEVPGGMGRIYSGQCLVPNLRFSNSLD